MAKRKEAVERQWDNFLFGKQFDTLETILADKVGDILDHYAPVHNVDYRELRSLSKDFIHHMIEAGYIEND